MWNEWEEREAEYNSFQNEQQAAFTHFLLTRTPRGDDAKINELVAAGRFVVFDEQLIFCSFTDAVAGSERGYLSDWGTREEAEKAAIAQAEFSEGIDILPRQTRCLDIIPDTDDSQIPF